MNTATREDYNAHLNIYPARQPRSTDFGALILDNAGYNPASHLGNQQQCTVCGKFGSECIGHPEVLNMALDDTNRTAFLSEFGITIIKKLTSVICTVCKTIVTNEGKVESNLDDLVKISDKRYRCECQRLYGSNPTIEPIGEEKIPESERQVEWREGRRRQKRRTHLELTTSEVETRDLIAEVDLSSLCLDRDYILGLFFDKIILVPTSVQQMNFKRSQGAGVEEVSKMTLKYVEMIENINSKNIHGIKTILRSLSVGMGSNHFSGTPSHLKVCDQKTGLFRGPGQNKRAKQSARSVLTPNTYGHCGELRCPKFIMSNLQNEYTVSTHNIEWLQAEVGRSVTHIITPLESSTTNGREIYKKISTQTKLRFGDRVLKELRDGDYVVFFRNPTLWRHSLIAYPIKQWDHYCLGLHETNTAGHNADFDGDEGNLWVGAKLAARIEMQMMDATYQLFSGRSGDPVIGIAYNGIVGAYVLSTDNNINVQTFNKLLDIIRPMHHDNSSRVRSLVIDEQHYQSLAKKYDVPYYSGRTLISMLFPHTLNYRRGNVVIKEGFMISGQLRAADVSKGLITAISAIDKWRAPYLFVDRGYAMMSAYISFKALTISSRDYVMPGDLRDQVIPKDYEKRLKEAEMQIIDLERSKAGRTVASEQRVEESISHILGGISNMVEDLLVNGEYSKTNGSIISYMSGARGNVGNIAATVVSVGQMYSGNDRYDPNVSRSSYYAPRDSLSIFDRGFIKSSYAEGLTQAEVMVVANVARRQALNTYLGTPASGNTANQTTRHQADIHLTDTLSVVDSNGSVLDCLYGYGCDSTMITYYKTPMGEIELPMDPLALLERVNNIL